MTFNSSSTTLGALCDEGSATLQTGPFGSQLHAYDYVESGVPVVPTEAIGRRAIRSVGIPQISAEKAEELSRHRLRIGDILFARRGVQATGLSGIVDSRLEDAICGTGAILLRLDDPQIDSWYMSFFLSSSETIRWLKAHAVGAVMPNLNESILRLLPIDLPPIDTQRTIVHILGTLDDKIELNRRMNETLEAMARAIFKSWFVDFDPVRAKLDRRQPPGLSPEIAALFPDSFEDSELGEVPKGWKAVPLPDVIDVNPKRVLKKGEVAPYLDMKNMPTQGHHPLRVYPRDFGSGTKFINDDTLMARITPCLENGKTAFVDCLREDEVGWGSTEYIVLRPKPPLPAAFAYYLARDDDFRTFAIQNMTGSSGRQRVPSDCFDRYLLPLPSERVASAFGRTVRPLMEKVRANCNQSGSLKEIRDALLPRLLSGELSLPECETEAQVTV